MAKRFIDTDIFSDAWFMELSKDAKLLYIYLFTNCDHAGIIELNKKLCKFQTEIKDLERVTKDLGNRLLTVRDNIYFLPKFIKFQYPNFPQSNVKQQESAIKILTAYGLFKNGCLTVTEDLPKDYDNDNDSDNGNEKKIPSLDEFQEYAKTIKIYHPSFEYQVEAKYNAWVENGWKDGNNNKILNWKTKLQNTMPHFKVVEGTGYHTKQYEPSEAMKKRLKHNGT